MEEWLATDGISHLKIKLAGNDIDWDVGRIVEITRICELVASERAWKLSFDFNEQCPDEDYVIDLLERIERLSPLSHDRLQYIEQPTPRDLTTRTDMTVHRISRLRPVVIDESLVDLESLHLARKQGYTGIALKACKGHSECLLMAAAAPLQSLYLFSGLDLRRRFIPSLRLPGQPHRQGGGYRGEWSSVLPGGQSGLHGEVCAAIPRPLWHRTDRFTERRGSGLRLAVAPGPRQGHGNDDQTGALYDSPRRCGQAVCQERDGEKAIGAEAAQEVAPSDSV